MQENLRTILGLAQAGLGPLVNPAAFAEKLGSRNWDFIIATARRHRLSSLLFEGVRKLELEPSLPDNVVETLRSAYYTNLTHNLVMFDHLERLIERARAEGAPLVLLKGVAFARWLYPHPALRPMADIDILVRKSDLTLFVRLAEKLGYQRREATDHAVSLRHTESATYLELHTHLTSCPGYLRIDAEALLARSSPTTLWEAPAQMLAPEDHLLHLCLHGSFQHGFRQPVINACDVYLLSKLPELQWEKFLNLSSPPHLAPLVYGGLTLCHRAMPDGKVRKTIESLEPMVPHRHRKWIAELDLSRILSPSSDSVAGSPWRRFTCAPGLKDLLVILCETIGAGGVDNPSGCGFPIRRGLGLVKRHLLPPKSKAPVQLRAVVRW